jgi:hypothetical protein
MKLILIYFLRTFDFILHLVRFQWSEFLFFAETCDGHRLIDLFHLPALMLCSLLSSGVLYCTVQRVMIPGAVIIQFVLLKMGMLMLETCRGLRCNMHIVNE